MNGLGFLLIIGGVFLIGHLTAWMVVFYLVGRQSKKERKFLNGER